MSMKIRGRTVSTPTPRANWDQEDPSKADYILNKPTILAEYQWPVIPRGIRYGDVNGDGVIDVRDERLVLRYVDGEITEEDLQLEAADVNGDGVVDRADAVLIGQYITGQITSFAAGKYLNWISDGEYWYYDLTVGGVTEGMEIPLLALGVDIVKTECHDGYVRVFVTEPPVKNVPYSVNIHSDCVKTVNGAQPDENGNVQIEVGGDTQIIAYGTEDLVAGESALGTGKLYIVYE